VLVAIVILSIALAVVYRSFGAALLAPERVAGRLGAAQVGQAVLERHLGVRTLVPGTFRGDQDGYQWVLAITPAAEGLEPRGGSRPWRLLALTVSVTWPGGKPLQLDTLQLARQQ
jgi:hypothetical protein